MTHKIASLPCLLALLLSGSALADGTKVGRLELTWGDPVSGSSQPTRFTVELVDEKGQRLALDPAEALRGAEDLYALNGQQVAVALGTADASKQPRVEAIVPAGASKAVIAPTVAGTTVWATIMCKFSDVAAEQKPLSFFNSQYGNSPAQLDHYWREVSYNKINLVGSAAYGWFTLPQPRAFYVPAGGSANLNKLFDDCTAVANASVNFAANGGLQGINMMFNGDLDGFAWGGGRCATLDGINKCWSATWNPPWSFVNTAPLSHEMGHAYGLPHANNSDNDGYPYDNPWDVMSDGWDNAVNNATYGALGKHLSIWSRDKLGFVDAARKLTINANGTYANLLLDRASLIGSTNQQMIIVRVAGQPTSKFYTIEARKRVGTYEAALAGDAVIIHSVDTTRSEPAWSVDASVPPANTANNEGSMFKVGETWTAPNNAFRVTVNSATAEGFNITVQYGP